MTEEVLKTILAERGTIRPERFMELMNDAAKGWETEASVQVSKSDRRSFEKGFHAGRAAAFRDMATLLKCYAFVKADASPLKVDSA